jgi:hypothetical protein
MSITRSPLLVIPFLTCLACSGAPGPAAHPEEPGSGETGGAGGRGGGGGATRPMGSAGAGGADGAAGAGGAGGAPGSGAPDALPPSGDAQGQPTSDGGAESPLASCQSIMDAANAFIGALEPAKKGLAVMGFEARKHYRFTPEVTRPGLPLSNMTKDQQDRALALLKATLSQSGYQKAMTIRTMDNWLKANVGQLPFGNMNYYVAIYGTPSALTNWAWHWEGHHASLHFTFVGCSRAASTPLMFGVEPAELAAAFEGLPAGTRVLGNQEDLARSLATMLAADPTKKAVAIADKGGRMLPNTPDKQGPQTPLGLSMAMMSAPEAAKLKELLAEVVGTVNPELAELRMKKVLDAGLDKVAFFWAGPLKRTVNAIYYFRVQGPTFIFEHNVEWENHVHSAWRDFDGDFGEDLLQLHLKQFPHRSASLYQE